MQEEQLKDKLKHILYKIVKPIYLYSVNAKSLDEYSAEMLMLELIYSDGSFAVGVLEDYLNDAEFYFKEFPKKKEKVQEFIQSFKKFKNHEQN